MAEAAQGVAMALADALGVNLLETFLAFIQSDQGQRERLLDIAGATGFLAEIENELAEGTSETHFDPRSTVLLLPQRRKRRSSRWKSVHHHRRASSILHRRRFRSSASRT
jgi:hypothetical protein